MDVMILIDFYVIDKKLIAKIIPVCKYKRTMWIPLAGMACLPLN